MSGDIHIDIDIEKADRVGKALRKGLSDGLEDTGKTLLREGKKVAEDEVAGVREWNSEVKEGFVTETSDFNRYYNFHGKIVNPVEHAEVVDEGLSASAEGPSVQDIMPWVVDNLRPADYGGGGGTFDTGGDDGDGDGGDGDRPGEITDEDRSIQYAALEQLGLDSGSFESDYAKAGTLGDGTNVIWKSHNDTDRDQDFKKGVIRNEVVWSKVAEDNNWNLGPRSRVETAEVVTGERDGTIQEYVEGQQLSDYMWRGYGDPDDYEVDNAQFLNENRDWAAKMVTTDYIVGNGDRHQNNVRVNPDGEPRTIDSGGNNFNENLKDHHLKGLSSWYKLYDHNADLQYEETTAMLDRAEEVLEEIATSEEERQNIINIVKEVHGEGSKEHDRIVKILGEEIGDGHILEEDSNGVPRYKRDIQELRDEIDRAYDNYNGGDSEADEILSENANEDDLNQEEKEKLNEELDEALGDVGLL
jgi:hypothetical protein